MRRNTVKKTIGKLILAGLVIGMLPTHLFASAPKQVAQGAKWAVEKVKLIPQNQQPIPTGKIKRTVLPLSESRVLKKFFPTWETKKPTKAEIDTAIAHIKDTRKRVQLMIATIIAITVGATVASIAAEILISVLISLVISAILPPANVYLVKILPGFEKIGPFTAKITRAIKGFIGTKGQIGKFIIQKKLTVVGTSWTGTVYDMQKLFEHSRKHAKMLKHLSKLTESGAISLKLVKPAAKSAMIPALVTGLVIAILTGVAIPFGGILTAGLTATKLIDSVSLSKALNRIEKKYPGILNADQIKQVQKLNKAIKGSTSKGIIKTIRLNKALDKISLEAIKQNPQLAQILKKKVIPRTKKYIRTSRRLENIEKQVANYRERKKQYKQKLKKHKLFTKEHIKASFNLLKMKTSVAYRSLKKKAKRLRARIIKYNRKYYGINRILAGAVQEYKKQANSILYDLKTMMERASEETMCALQDAVIKGVEKVEKNKDLVKKIGKEKIEKTVRKLIDRQKEVDQLNKLIAEHKQKNKRWNFLYQAKVNRRNKLTKKLNRDNKKYPGLFDLLKEPTAMYIKMANEIDEKYKKAF